MFELHEQKLASHTFYADLSAVYLFISLAIGLHSEVDMPHHEHTRCQRELFKAVATPLGSLLDLHRQKIR